MDNCLFCNTEYRRGNSFFENETFFAAFDTYPVSPGHTIIIPKRHVVNFLDITPEEWKKLYPTIQEVIQIIETTDFEEIYKTIKQKNISENSVLFCDDALNHPRINTKPDAYNHGLNDGRALEEQLTIYIGTLSHDTSMT